MKTTTSLLVLLVAFIFSSCCTFNDVSIEKRRYGKGYYVHVRDDRAKENTVVPENQNPQEEVAAVKIREENNAPVGEISAQPVPSAAASKSFSKEKHNRVLPPTSFKKGNAVFLEKTPATKSTKPAPTPAHDGDDEHVVAMFLLIILAIILPPLAVLLVDGLGVHFLVDLIFWLLGFGFVIFIPGGGFVYLGIFGLIAIIYALFVIFDII